MKSTILWDAMSEIPYYFETPVPKYFRETGWFKNPNTILFVTWAFSKCSTQAHTVVHDSKEIHLEAYEFITGRGSSSLDCLLSEGALRNQLNSMQNAGLLKKTTNSVTNRYTCYVWSIDRFCKNNNQPNNQQATNWAPTEQPQTKNKEQRTKEKEEQQHKPVSVSVVVPLSLQNFMDESILDQHRKELASKYSKEVIDDAIDSITESKFQPSSTMLKALRAACKDGWKPKKININEVDKNKNIAQALEGKHNRCNYTSCNKHLEIVRGSIVETISYEMTFEKFCSEIERIGKINIEKALNIV